MFNLNIQSKRERSETNSITIGYYELPCKKMRVVESGEYISFRNNEFMYTNSNCLDVADFDRLSGVLNLKAERLCVVNNKHVY